MKIIIIYYKRTAGPCAFKCSSGGLEDDDNIIIGGGGQRKKRKWGIGWKEESAISDDDGTVKGH